MATPLPFERYCADHSLEMGESLTASATRVHLWLLLEVNAPWGGKALAESSLPEAIKARLLAWEKNTPGARVQFIKHSAPAFGGLHLFFACSAGEKPRLTSLSIHTYEDLLDIPLPASPADELPGAVLDEPMLLVCTNAKRDACCARLGLPLFNALSGAADSITWQTTHLGGHRFAPAQVVLPYGHYYGRLTLAALPAWLAAVQERQVYLDAYRGRCIYPPPVQAAEHALRQQTNLTGWDDLRLLDSQETPEGWQVIFASAQHQHYRVTILPGAEPLSVQQSCRDAEPSPAPTFRPMMIEHLD